jgi:hypothetical protein
VLRSIVVLLALSTIGCNLTGPDENLSGSWLANSGGHFSFVEISLQQNGDEITGTACANSDGVLLYSGTPVFGEYPDLQFTVSGSQIQPCCSVLVGSQFRGHQDGSKDIVGTYRGVDIRFKRSTAPLCH